MRRTLAVLAVALVVSTGCAPEPYERELIDLTNVYRFAGEVVILDWCFQLGQAAKAHAEDMAANDRLGNAGSDGSDVALRVERAGYTGWTRVGQNISLGPETPRAVANSWLANSTYRATLLDGRFTDAGVGRAVAADGDVYWAMVLGSNDSVC